MDGGTDRALIPIIEWAIHRLDPQVEILEPDFRKRLGSVKDFIGSYKTGAMMIFVDRDAEGEPIEDRLREFDGVTRCVVPVVPVRMTEAWVLCGSTQRLAIAEKRPTERRRTRCLASSQSGNTGRSEEGSSTSSPALLGHLRVVATSSFRDRS